MLILKVLVLCATCAFGAAYSKEPYECPYATSSYGSTDATASALAATAITDKDIEHLLKITNNIRVLEPVPEQPYTVNSLKSLLQNIYHVNAAPSHTRISNNIFKNDAFNEGYNDFKHVEPKSFKCAVGPRTCANDSKNLFYRTFDGSCNNLEYTSFGMAKSRYTRFLPPKYGDGVYAPALSVSGHALPNARHLSLTLFGEHTRADPFRTLATMQWGQVVAHDISMLTTKGAPADCCEDIANKRCFPIMLKPQGPIARGSGKTCAHFARALTDADATCTYSGLPYAEKISSTSAFLDLSSVYGNSLEESQKTRQFVGGLLKNSWLNNKQLPPIVTNSADGECGDHSRQCYAIPDRRNQFTPINAVLHTILLREHNRLANALASLNPHLLDEIIYQEARKINIAQYQKITYYDWLPTVLGPSFAYGTGLIHAVPSDQYVDDYDVGVNAAPYAAYASAAFRYSHNQIPGKFALVSSQRSYNQTMRLSDYFERSENVNLMASSDNFDSIVRGLVTQLQKSADGNIDKEIKHFFDRKEFEEFGFDLKAIDIQRARDFGLASYNDFRQFCGLPRAFYWSDFGPEISPEKIAQLQELYASPDDVELSIGGAFERHSPEAIFGTTFQCLIGRQFLKTRTGDRFFFEHRDNFNRDQLAEIRKASLSGLLCNNADTLQDIQFNSFNFPTINNILTSCHNIPQVNLRMWMNIHQHTYY